jgi:hypothetical protein
VDSASTSGLTLLDAVLRERRAESEQHGRAQSRDDSAVDVQDSPFPFIRSGDLFQFASNHESTSAYVFEPHLFAKVWHSLACRSRSADAQLREASRSPRGRGIGG